MYGRLCVLAVACLLIAACGDDDGQGNQNNNDNTSPPSNFKYYPAYSYYDPGTGTVTATGIYQEYPGFEACELPFTALERRSV